MKSKKNKPVLFLICLVIFFLLAGSPVFLLSCGGNTDIGQGQDAGDTEQTTVDLSGKQLIEVVASGGYYPGTIDAEASIATVLRIKSENAYGCERAFRLPQLRIGATLPINGIVDIDIGSFEPGTKILGTCSMGMYTFVINFK